MNFTSDISVSMARGAFGGVSMSPERRGDSFRSEYSQQLAEYYEILKAHATKGGTFDLLEQEFAIFRAGYRRASMAFLASESRCISSFITGPSNFPVRRAEKRNAVAHKRLSALVEYPRYALKRATRILRPDLRPIMAGDSDAIARLDAELEQLERKQGQMKAANAAIRRNKKGGPAAQVGALVFLGYREKIAEKLLEPDFCGRIGFADYQLTNNGANIRRIKARIAQISRAKAAPVVEIESANGIRLEDDPPANRVRLFFPGKPPAEERERLKRNGFRWSPTIGAWQAYRNASTLQLAQQFGGAA